MTETEPDMQDLTQRVMDRVAKVQHARTLRARVLTGTVIAAAAAGSIAGVWAAAAPPLAQEYSATCFMEADLNAPSMLVASPDISNGEPVTGDRVERALDLCGGLIPGTSDIEENPTGMVACELVNKTIAVFPVDEGSGNLVCRELGLAYLSE